MTTSTELKSFHFAFQITRKIVFEVNYYRLGNNKDKHFATSAAEFNQPKTDFTQCGQAQKELLKEGRKAMSFYKKWDKCHIQDLTPDQHSEVLKDIEVLKSTYNFIEKNVDIRFGDLKQLSMSKITTQRPSFKLS